MIECSGCGIEFEHELLDTNPICPNCSEPYYSKPEVIDQGFDNEGIIFGDDPNDTEVKN
jgi:hypothetical protein